MKRLSYYQRIFQAYLGGGNSQLSFWHETPAVNERAFESGSRHYYMTFEQKALYAGPFDDNGIPMLDYRGSIGRQYNPIAISQYGLGCWNLYLDTQDSKWKDRFLLTANWLTANLKANAAGVMVWQHYFDFEYFQTLKTPWYSGLAQGQGLSVLLRAYNETNDNKYLAATKAAFKSLTTPIQDGGVLFVDDADDWWIEEYITTPPTHIINGFMWALWGVYDYAKINDDAKELWDRCLRTIEKNIESFDMGFWSKYDLAPLGMPNPASPFYHKLHIVQLEIMYRLSSHELFERYREKWSNYQNNIWKMKLAFIMKAGFKLLHY